MYAKHLRQQPRRGVVLVLAALLMVVIFGMVAFAIDIGYISFVKTELQRSADAAAHAAVIELVKTDSADSAIDTAKTMAAFNKAAGKEVELDFGDVKIGRRNLIANSNPAAYNYDWTNASGANCVKVIAKKTKQSSMGPLSLFFAPVMGIADAEVEATSIAVLAPRDIVLVIDVSGSMHHDTEPWSINALNWLSTVDGVGAGDAAMKNLWSDLGMEGVVPYPLPDTEEYRWNMNTKTNNMKVDLPGSPSSYTSITVENNNGTPRARLNITDIKNMLKSAPFVTTNAYGTKTKISDSNWSKYAWKDSNDGSLDVKAYDFIIDKILPSTMANAKPSLASQSSRDAYRSYWRGYLNYTRGSSGLNNGRPGDGTGGGINNAFTNPSGDQRYQRPDGSTYSSSSLAADTNALQHRVDYMTYIQFMMDMSNDGKAGLNSSGNQDSSSNRKYTPMSQRFTGSGSDAYRWTDSDGFERFPREQPMGSLVDAVIAALKQIKADNPTSVPAHSRDHIALVIFAQNYKTITSNPSSASNPFTYDYDACMLLASQLQAECQDMGASTNTNGGLSQALSSLNSYSRNYANRVTVLFTDGVPNSGSTPSPLSSSQMVDMDGDGTLDTNYYYSNTTANKYKNAALVAAQQLANARTVVHTVCAGGGRDTDITKRMSVLSRGIYRDSGSNLHEYASNLINDIKDLTNAKVPKMTLLGPSDTETN